MKNYVSSLFTFFTFFEKSVLFVNLGFNSTLLTNNI